MPSITMLPPLPPRTVLMMTRAMTNWSPGLDMEPMEPPLKARNPAIRIIPPIPVSCNIAGSVVDKELCYKPEGRGFETRRYE
jgi:hypothetical protein